MSKSNVNPNHYKVAGRERQGEAILQERHRQKFARSLVRERFESPLAPPFQAVPSETTAWNPSEPSSRSTPDTTPPARKRTPARSQAPAAATLQKGRKKATKKTAVRTTVTRDAKAAAEKRKAPAARRTAVAQTPTKARIPAGRKR
ncbi:MAG: hypothetical protein M3468_15590 [Acidobacteriota bacterium]|nr:hypothetical protein [Acidobacteriota bacterium]